MFFVGLLSSHLTYLFVVVIYISGYGGMVFNSQEADSFSIIDHETIAVNSPEVDTLEDILYCQDEQQKSCNHSENNLFIYKSNNKPLYDYCFHQVFENRFEQRRITTRPPPYFV